MRFPGAEPRPPAPQTRPRRAGQGFQFPPPRCEMTDEKEKLLAAAISQIEKDHGKGAIMRLGSRDILVPVSVIPSGCLSIDAALGVGGFPRGRVIEIYGPESGGKTTMTLHVIAEAQKLGGQAAFIDAEHALDPGYARKLGVDVDNLLVSQPDNGEQALEIAETLIRSGGVDIVVVDSVAALVPKAELEGDMGDPQMGLQARLMSQALRKLTGIVSKSRTCWIFINQIGEKIGVMLCMPEQHTGGGRKSKVGWRVIGTRQRTGQTATLLQRKPRRGLLEPQRRLRARTRPKLARRGRCSCSELGARSERRRFRMRLDSRASTPWTTTWPDEGSGSCSDGQLFIIKHIARTRARCLLCEGGANSKICLILRETVSLRGRDFHTHRR